MKNSNLLSIPTHVESPFIIVKIGDYEFGSISKTRSDQKSVVRYPNYLKSLSVVKINGSVNTYTIVFEYQVSVYDDPNMLDMVFSSVSNDRAISIQYGDWNAPAYIYREEKAIITNLRTQLDMNASRITYTLQCTGDAVGLSSVQFTFPPRTAKPSDVLKEMLQSDSYGLKGIFKGMQDISKVNENGWIASNDIAVSLEGKKKISPIAYMNYLVSCMKSSVDSRNSVYMFSIRDDYLNEHGGMWFEVIEVSSSNKAVESSSSSTSADVYSIDINYPTENLVTNFSVNNDQSWALLYNYAQDIKQEEYIYKIQDDGTLTTEYSPVQMRSGKTESISEAKATWWRKMTSFPIEATLTIKGLIRASILMSYVKLNVWFHGGNKHVASGYYIITKQQDTLDASGYKTTLTLLRVGEDE